MTPAAHAATLAVPVEQGVAAMPCIVRERDQWACAWMLSGGRDKRTFAAFPADAAGRRKASALLRALEARRS